MKKSLFITLGGFINEFSARTVSYHPMVLLYQMVTYNTLLTCEKKNLFYIFEFETVDDLNKCLKQVKVLISLHMCALITELPSNVCTKHLTNLIPFIHVCS